MPAEALPVFALADALPAGAALPAATRVWLIRHGQTQWSATGRHTGRTDIDLTPAGEQQAQALRPILGALGPVTVLCSPRRRALRTAELAGLTVTAIDPDLAEWDYGDYEGLTSAQIQTKVADWTVFSHPIPGGESASDVTIRAVRVLVRSMGYVMATSQPVVLVTHGHLGRVLGALWIGLTARDGARLQSDVASVSALGVQHDRPVLDRWNMPAIGASVL
jgi:broad specificity phosphatase PhoE